MYNAVLISSVQSDSDCFPFFFRFFSIIDYYKVLSCTVGPCCLFILYIECVPVNPKTLIL